MCKHACILYTAYTVPKDLHNSKAIRHWAFWKGRLKDIDGTQLGKGPIIGVGYAAYSDGTANCHWIALCLRACKLVVWIDLHNNNRNEQLLHAS